MKESEHSIQSAILEYLTLKGIFHYRNNSGAMSGENKGKKWFMRFGAKGSPDIVCVIAGRYVGLEVKSKVGKQSEAQKAFRDSLHRAQGFYHIVRSVYEAQELVENLIKILTT